MGAWDIKAFDNDDAMDWLEELDKSDGLRVLSNALRKSLMNTLFMEAPKASMIIAAAEIICSAKLGDVSELPEPAKKWVQRNDVENFAKLKKPAIKALGSVLSINSELRWLWFGNRELNHTWRKYVLSLIETLKS